MSEEKKLTDDEIVKAYEHCDDYIGCEPCILANQVCRLTVIDLIHRLQSKVAELREVNAGLALANLYDLPPNEDCLTDNEFEVARKTIAEQKAEIERLTAENGQLKGYNSGLEYELEIKQKQVDELKERAKIDLENERNWGKIQTKQAVKDTAKEIYQEIDKSDILVVETQEYGEIEVVPIERLQEIIKNRGVEVE